MIQIPTSRHAQSGPVHAASTAASFYTREAFRAILARHPEWKIRVALEEGNIPTPNIAHALEWLEERARAH